MKSEKRRFMDVRRAGSLEHIAHWDFFLARVNVPGQPAPRPMHAFVPQRAGRGGPFLSLKRYHRHSSALLNMWRYATYLRGNRPHILFLLGQI